MSACLLFQRLPVTSWTPGGGSWLSSQTPANHDGQPRGAGHERERTLPLMRFDKGLDANAVASEGEDQEPEYRVSFWSLRGTTWLNEWVGITEADVDEVIDWAKANAAGRHYTIWARSIVGDGAVLDVRLFGAEPHDVNGGWEPRWARRAEQDFGKAPRTLGMGLTD